MSFPIQTQSQQFAGFADSVGTYASRDRRAVFDVPDGVPEYLASARPGITAGLNNPRLAVDTRGMDPDAHAYATESPWGDTDGGGQRRHFDPNYGYDPTDLDEAQREAVGEDDDSGYNWGPEPGHDPGAEPGPHPDFHGDAPHPFDTPTYSPGGGVGEGYDDTSPPPPRKPDMGEWDLPSFNTARRHADGGPTQTPDRPFTALAVPPAQVPAGQGDPVWIGHPHSPGSRVGTPWRDRMIPGTVTHLEGYNVGVRWDDGQHSVEEPANIQALHQWSK